MFEQFLTWKAGSSRGFLKVKLPILMYGRLCFADMLFTNKKQVFSPVYFSGTITLYLKGSEIYLWFMILDWI
jgi:hypothetical protein